MLSFQPAEFLADTLLMTNEQLGIYVRLLFNQHQNGEIPKTVFNALVNGHQLVRLKFIETEDGFYNKNLTDSLQNTSKYIERFDQFWAAYPKKEGKGACRKIFEKLKPSEALLQNMLKAISTQKKSEKWLKDNGQYIPMPATWLNQGRWEDQIYTKMSELDDWYKRKLEEEDAIA